MAHELCSLESDGEVRGGGVTGALSEIPGQPTSKRGWGGVRGKSHCGWMVEDLTKAACWGFCTVSGVLGGIEKLGGVSSWDGSIRCATFGWGLGSAFGCEESGKGLDLGAGLEWRRGVLGGEGTHVMNWTSTLGGKRKQGEIRIAFFDSVEAPATPLRQ